MAKTKKIGIEAAAHEAVEAGFAQRSVDKATGEEMFSITPAGEAMVRAMGKMEARTVRVCPGCNLDTEPHVHAGEMAHALKP